MLPANFVIPSALFLAREIFFNSAEADCDQATDAGSE
jgi:hypothetical protein